MKNLIHIIFLFALMQQSILPQWYQQNSGTAKFLYGVTFMDENNGWIVGDSGTILHTSNSGIDWINQNSGTKRTLSDISFSNLNHGTAVGDSGMILRTNDGGLNWFQQTSGTNAFLHSISFVSANIGWSVGCVYNPLDYYGIILHTENAGETWEQQFVMDNQFLYEVSFVDTNIGWAVGHGGTILHTTDGGISWCQQTSGTIFPILDVCFIDSIHGWVVGGYHDICGFVLRTTNGGLTWAQQLISATLFFRAHFTDENNGTVVGWEYGYTDLSILRTTDGGTNWNPQSSGTFALLYDVFFADAVNGWVVGAGGTILHTTNGGVPVELTSFTVKSNGKEIILNWSTATELNNQGFEIQRSTEGEEFFTVGFVNGHGTTTEQQNYSYTDRNLDNGNYYYRLKQTDYNGSFEYSDVIEVDVRSLNEYALDQNYPNPFNSSCAIKYSIPKSSQISLKIFNTLGEEIETLVDEVKPTGSHELTWNAANLPSGVYFYRLQAGDFVQTRKMILMK